jgi:hypothetical protein
MSNNNNHNKLIRFDYENNALYELVGDFEKYLGKITAKNTGITRNNKLAAVAARGKWIAVVKKDKVNG